jgi:hypothetical protein
MGKLQGAYNLVEQSKDIAFSGLSARKGVFFFNPSGRKNHLFGRKQK